MNFTLITGASSGIGFELAHVFARKQHNLILVARSKQKLDALAQELEQTYSISAIPIALDLSHPEGAHNLYQEIQTKNLMVENLINNAGIGDLGYFIDSQWERQKEMIQLNITALTQLTHLFLPLMIKNNHGKIMNVASTAAFQAGPVMSVYYATKAYVLSFSEALSEELKGTGVTITALCPGPTHSGFQKTANFSDDFLKQKVFKLVGIPSSAAVAEYGYQEFMKGTTVAIHGFINSLGVFMVRLSPRSLARKAVKKLQDQRRGK